MNKDELLEAWGREVLRDAGFTIADDASVSIELTTESYGCCEMCYSESAVMHVKSGKAVATVSYLD